MSLTANAIGSAIANKRKREAEKAYREGIEEQINDINSEINSNYFDRADAQNAVRKVTDSNTETLRQLNTEAIRGGATDEAKVAMASQLTKNTASVVGDLAAVGEQHKDRLKEQKRSLRNSLLTHQYNVDGDTSGIDTITSSISSAANSLGAAWDGRKDIPVTPNGEGIDTTTPASEAAKASLTAKPQVKYGELIKTW